VLGFSFERYWGDPPSFVTLHRDDVQIMLRSTGRKGRGKPNRIADRDVNWDAYIYVTDISALFEELKERKAKVLNVPNGMLAGINEIEVEDCNGYILCFGQDVFEQARS
jgi:hypothetical protein